MRGRPARRVSRIAERPRIGRKLALSEPRASEVAPPPINAAIYEGRPRARAKGPARETPPGPRGGDGRSHRHKRPPPVVPPRRQAGGFRNLEFFLSSVEFFSAFDNDNE